MARIPGAKFITGKIRIYLVLVTHWFIIYSTIFDASCVAIHWMSYADM